MKPNKENKENQPNQPHRTVILRGEGSNLHVLEGEYVEIEPQDKDSEVRIFKVEEAFVQHETPAGNKAEHETLKANKGMYVLGKQVEYNPMLRIITRIWD